MPVPSEVPLKSFGETELTAGAAPTFSEFTPLPQLPCAGPGRQRANDDIVKEILIGPSLRIHPKRPGSAFLANEYTGKQNLKLKEAVKGCESSVYIDLCLSGSLIWLT